MRDRYGEEKTWRQIDPTVAQHPYLVGGLVAIFGIFPFILGMLIIPIDVHIFQRGGPTTHTPRWHPSGNPLVDSVAEHQPANPKIYASRLPVSPKKNDGKRQGEWNGPEESNVAFGEIPFKDEFPIQTSIAMGFRIATFDNRRASPIGMLLAMNP